MDKTQHTLEMVSLAVFGPEVFPMETVGTPYSN